MRISGYRCFAALLACCLCGAALAEDLQATVGWSEKVELGTLVSGVVDKVHVRPGRTVAKGDELVSLDDRGFRAEVGRGKAAYRHARSVLAEARREDERAIELYERTVLSDFERNQALIALNLARATAESARADLVHAELDLERSVIRAPFDGVVLAVNVAPGQTIVSDWQSQPLVMIANDRVYRVRAQIDAGQADRLQPGSGLKATVRGELMPASVSFIGFEPTAQSEHGPVYQLVAEIEMGGDRTLRVGEKVVLHLD